MEAVHRHLENRLAPLRERRDHRFRHPEADQEGEHAEPRYNAQAETENPPDFLKISRAVIIAHQRRDAFGVAEIRGSQKLLHILGDGNSRHAVFPGQPGKYVPLKETIRGFKEILEGRHDDMPENAFYMVGTIDEAVAKAEKLKEEA